LVVEAPGKKGDVFYGAFDQVETVVGKVKLSSYPKWVKRLKSIFFQPFNSNMNSFKEGILK